MPEKIQQALQFYCFQKRSRFDTMMLSSTPTQDPLRYRSVFLPVLMFLVCCCYTPTSSSNISLVVHGLSPMIHNISSQQQPRRQNVSNNNKRNRKTSTILLNNNNGQVVPETSTTNAITTTSSRRSFVSQIVFKSIAATTASAGVMETCCRPSFAMDNNNDITNDNKRGFVSDAFPKAEYTNSIVASRDTNVSPKEVYDSILSIKGNDGKSTTTIAKDGAPAVVVPPKRALDVGAGAGVSTQVLYEEMGYTTIDALDWSGDAWDLNVVQNGYCPPSVQFYELDDERFYNTWKSSKMEPYDVIVFNFAVNKNKALKFAKELLKEDGLLLAPVNTQTDYWLKQTYVLLTAQGTILWSANDVGAWSVQFQPDVTQDTCQGIWCPPYNGFKKQ